MNIFLTSRQRQHSGKQEEKDDDDNQKRTSKNGGRGGIGQGEGGGKGRERRIAPFVHQERVSTARLKQRSSVKEKLTTVYQNKIERKLKERKTQLRLSSGETPIGKH